MSSFGLACCPFRLVCRVLPVVIRAFNRDEFIVTVDAVCYARSYPIRSNSCSCGGLLPCWHEDSTHYCSSFHLYGPLDHLWNFHNIHHNPCLIPSPCPQSHHSFSIIPEQWLQGGTAVVVSSSGRRSISGTFSSAAVTVSVPGPQRGRAVPSLPVSHPTAVGNDVFQDIGFGRRCCGIGAGFASDAFIALSGHFDSELRAIDFSRCCSINFVQAVCNWECPAFSQRGRRTSAMPFHDSRSGWRDSPADSLTWTKPIQAGFSPRSSLSCGAGH